MSLSLASASGCSLFGSDLERQQQLDNLEECQGGASESQALDTILISEEYGESLHEMIACGNITLLFCGALVVAVFENLEAGAEGKTPDGWSFADGVYRTQNTGVSMDLELVLTQDLDYGAAGTRVQENVFLSSSYFVGASVSVDQDAQTVSIAYESTGPLVELLGFGAQPENPLVISTSELETAAKRLGTLAFSTQIHLDDEVDTSTIVYHLESPQMTANELINEGQITYQIVEADGHRSDLDQTLSVTDWSIEFVDHAVLDGYTEFAVTGGAFDYGGRISFDHSAIPERELFCL